MKQSLAPGSPRYSLPTGGHIDFSFFPRRESDLSIKGGRLIGGAYVAVEHNISANVLLVSDGSDDLYGRWIGCFLRINALVDPRKIIGTREMTQHTVAPFGLRYADDFFTDIQWAERGTHVFNYELRTDIQQFLIDVFETALQGPVHS